MLTNEVMSPAADSAAAQYGTLIAAWQGLYAQARVRADLGSARSFTAIQTQAIAVAQTVGEGLRNFLLGALDEVALQALADVSAVLGTQAPDSLPEAVYEAVSALYEHVHDELDNQIRRDVAHLTQTLRRHALQVSLAARARRIPLNLAIMQARIGGGDALDFGVRDRGGKRWPSRRFVRTLVRHALVTAYNETALIALAEAGIDRAQVRHLDPRSDVHGLVVAMGPDGDLPTYAEIRDSVFHPNAEALIAPLGAR